VTFRTEVVRDSARFQEIAGSWETLWRGADAHVFQSHPWLTAWWEGVRERGDSRLAIMLAWDGNRLAGAMPCVIHRHRGLRILSWAAQLFSDYCDVLVDPEYQSHTVSACLWDGFRQAVGFDITDFKQVRPDAVAYPLLRQITRTLDSGATSEKELCLRIENRWPDGHAWFRSLGKKGRNNFTRGRRILSELGGEVQVAMHTEAAGLEPIMDRLIALKRDWLQRQVPDSPLLGPDGELLKRLICASADTGRLMVFLVEAGGVIATGSVNFVYDDRMQAYLTAYDSAYDRASPGMMVMIEYTRWAFDRGMKEVDFLRGDEPFKFRIANAELGLSRFKHGHTMLGRAATGFDRWRSYLRGAIQRPPGEIRNRADMMAPERTASDSD
jgi:CelD/BcsL family acetyltransferase involved in cellulose biosynthesis